MKCLIIGKVWPEPNSTAAGRRTLDVVDALQLSGGEVHFASAALRSEHALPLQQIGVEVHSIAVNDSAFDGWITQLKPEVVVFDRFMTEEQFGWRVTSACPDALRILDTSDLHCLRLAREKALRTNSPLDLQNDSALREIASIYRSDLTLMISDHEIGILSDEFKVPSDLLAYWPFSVEPPDLEESRSFNERENLVLIGSFLHPPNLDAARWARHELWPLVHDALPGVELHCYGSYGDKYKGELHDPNNGFHFLGRAEDALETMSAYRLNLAPLRYGAGLKGKVFDGFMTGTPSVLTPIAAEGIFDSHESYPSTARDFADAVIRLYQSEADWVSARQEGQSCVMNRFERDFWFQEFSTILQDARDQLYDRRRANFIGQLLRHHNHRSTEFMSRWIEAKNRSLPN